MGQKVRPTGFRTGIMVDWLSRWYASKQDFAELLLEDNSIRKFIQTYLTDKKDRKQQRPAIADIRIERTREQVTVVVSSSHVGAIVGKKGEKIDKLTKALEKLTRRHIEVKTVEVTRPESWSLTPLAPPSIARCMSCFIVRRKLARFSSCSAMSSAMS